MDGSPVARGLEVTPHIAQKTRYSAIDGRTTRHQFYAVSQRKRKLVEQVFGWMKTVDGSPTPRCRGGALIDWVVTIAAAAYNSCAIADFTGAVCLMAGAGGGHSLAGLHCYRSSYGDFQQDSLP